jgi:hypothetical protein
MDLLLAIALLPVVCVAALWPLILLWVVLRVQLWRERI